MPYSFMKTQRNFFQTALLLSVIVQIQALAAPVFLRSTVGDPWGITSDEQAMNRVMGVGNWLDWRYETVNTSSLFSTTNRFIFIEGSDKNALVMGLFLTNNLTSISNWVAGGGNLFVNSAPNQGGNQYLGFGVSLVFSNDYSTAANTGMCAVVSHPIFNTPYLPVGTSWTGVYFAHAYVQGGNLTALITNQTGGAVILGEKSYGAGRMLFGGMTLDYFHSPQLQSSNLTANIIAYLGIAIPPAITTQPANQTVVLTSNATFSVTASGAAPLAYQWIFNGTGISGGTNSSLTVSNASLASVGNYSVIITNSYGSVTSSLAALSIASAPVITAQPIDAVPFTNTTASFSVTASGNPAPTYQWRFNGAVIGGATGSTYSFIATPANVGNYDVIVSNYVGSVTSSVATLALATPRSITVAAMSNAREYHTDTLLPNGKVLIAGGTSGSALASAVLFDPVTGTMTATSPMSAARYGHTATLLLNGKVLVAAGYNGVPLGSAELYDPVLGTWTTTGTMHTNGANRTATLLPNGKVLACGGNDDTGALAGAEVYDPATGIWSLTGNLTTARRLHTATLLPNGKVLVCGGQDASGNTLASVEIFDPATGTWMTNNSMSTARSSLLAVLLPNGKVLVAGGRDNANTVLTSSEIFDPATGNWTPTGALNTARRNASATLLPNGKVLATGGYNGAYLASSEIYDPAAATWTTTISLNTARYAHPATLLANGKVLITGGETTGGAVLSSVELYDYATGTFFLLEQGR